MGEGIEGPGGSPIFIFQRTVKSLQTPFGERTVKSLQTPFGEGDGLGALRSSGCEARFRLNCTGGCQVFGKAPIGGETGKFL